MERFLILDGFEIALADKISLFGLTCNLVLLMKGSGEASGRTI